MFYILLVRSYPCELSTLGQREGWTRSDDPAYGGSES